MNQKIHFLILAFLMFTISTNAQTSSNEKAARTWIENNKEKLKITANYSLSLRATRKSPIGETLRFQQMINEVPVFDTEVMIHFSPYNEIDSWESSFDAKLSEINTVPAISKENAISISNNALKIDGEIKFQECKLFVYNKLETTKLVYRL